jgi:mRNA interferase MazF
MVTRGDIYWYEPPEAKRRPYLILSRSEAIPVLKAYLAVPATRTVRGIGSEVALDGADGMPTVCALSFDNLTTVHRAYLTDRITSLAAHRWHEVCDALAFATAC